MSYLDVDRVFDLNIPFPEKIVALALARYSKKGKCFPSMQKIAKITGCCRVSVWRYLTKLEVLGFIKIVKKQGLGNHYNLELDRGKNDPDQPAPSGNTSPTTTGFCELHPPVNSSNADLLQIVTLTSNRTSNLTGNGDKSRSKAPPADSFKNWTEEKFLEVCKTANEGNRYLSESEFPKFVRYYSEPDETGKMKVNRMKTWSTSSRLATWRENMLKWDTGSRKKAVNHLEQPKGSDIFAS